MAPDLFCQSGNTDGRIRLQAAVDPTDPGGWSSTVFGSGARDEALQARTQLLLGRVAIAQLRQRARQRSHAATHPPLNGRVRDAGAPEPLRVELDLDLLEPHRRYLVAMGSSGAIEDRRGAGNGQLAEVGMVRVGADHEE